MFKDFAFLLTLAVFTTGMFTLVGALAYRGERKKQTPLVFEYARSFFPVLLLVWIIRSFMFQPYRVPTGSLEPTVLPGDFIIVSQFAYGLRFPVFEWKLIGNTKPKRGDITLFHWPVDPKVIFVKRVIGLPGDRVEYKDKVLYINGKEMRQTFERYGFDREPHSEPISVLRKSENLMGLKHDIFVQPEGGQNEDYDVVVPPGHYFMMGDNRDDSDDSRVWGFVPEKMLIGKALGVIFSWNHFDHRMRWDRMGLKLG